MNNETQNDSVNNETFADLLNNETFADLLNNGTFADSVENETQNDLMNNETEIDYTRLIAAQNESKRRLKIKSINNTLTAEQKKKSKFAIASGVCFAGLLVATCFSGVDPKQAIQTEIQALNSFDALKEYLETFTPAMWGTMIATAGSFSKYIRHKKRYEEANQEFYDMINIKPEDYYDIIEDQVKKR